MATYSTSSGERLEKSVINNRITKAKAQKIEEMSIEHGYIFCEDCGINANNMISIDCSHDISVKKCQESGMSELAYDVNNITMRCRNCHRKHDKTV